LMDEDLQVNLAISLHAATDTLRSQLVPINQRYPLDDLFAAVNQYTARTQRRVMFEWVMIDKLNDTREQAEALAARLAGLPAHVNVIRLNPTPDYDGQPATLAAIEAFTAVLDRAGVPHTMRQRRGGAIEAGCGQLRRREVAGGGRPTPGRRSRCARPDQRTSSDTLTTRTPKEPTG
jgi:23S rRNA (adenine2503-C2)-methyltransferase